MSGNNSTDSPGHQTANWIFIEYAKIYKQAGYPVIAIIRDIRDALAGAPLPDWVTESSTRPTG
jgi:hypothetical protein